LKRRSTIRCTRPRSGCSSAAASVEAATPTVEDSASTSVVNATTPMNAPASSAVMIA